MIDKHHNWEYLTGVPLAAGDRYYAQDLLRDFWYKQDRAGYVLKDLSIAIPFIISGGVVTKGAGDTLNITAGIGYCKYSVTVPLLYSATPPTTQSQDIEAIRTSWTAQTNLAIPSATLNGIAVNYVKVRYAETDGNSRNRAKKAGSYIFEKTPSFTIVVDTTPNTAYDILLNTFVGTAGGAFTFSGVNSPTKSKILEVDNVNYTILDTDGYDTIIFKNLSADRYLYLPTLADNQYRNILVINATGTWKVIVTPEGTEKINTWNSPVNITEVWGWWRFIGSIGQWNGLTDGNSSVIEVSSETADSGLTLDATWDDVTGMALTLTPGKWLISARAVQNIKDTSLVAELLGDWGLGTLSGNNAPNIARMKTYYEYISTIANVLDQRVFNRLLKDEPYIISSDITIYMKAYATSDELNVTSHTMYGTTHCPMYIRGRRIA